MKKITLPGGRSTSQLGLGCGPLHGGLLAAESRRLLDAAFEAGIRHFDVAPPYGLGLAEGVVGKAFAKRHAETTLTTKAGIARPRRPLLISTIRTVVKPVLGRIPGWYAAAHRVRETAAPSGYFDPQFVRRSFAESLARLGRERVDMFLLHEVEDAAVTPQLVALLKEFESSGLAAAVGVGTLRRQAEAIARRFPEIATVQQFKWNAFEAPLPNDAESLFIIHGAVGPALARAGEIFAADPEACSRWSAATDADLADPAVLADVLLGAAFAENPNGLVLFWSHHQARIRRAAAVASNQAIIEAGARLTRTLRAQQQGNVR
ncbi:MAG: aldo/keto reductase [Alphaproteobacteria bacterium]|nr:aldo/keto reductase [Alphaproteobacteria bacterium]